LDPDPAFIDQIYEAAVLPEVWPRVLERLAQIAVAAGTVLITSDTRNVRWLTTSTLHPIVETWEAEGWHLRNNRMPRLLAMAYPGFVRAEDIFSADEIAGSDEINEFWRPRGFGTGVGTLVQVPSGDCLVFSVETFCDRELTSRSAIRDLDALRPHLARAALISGRLQLQRAQAMTAVLNELGLPAAVLRHSGRLLAVNPRFDALVPSLFQDRRARLAVVERNADILLRAAVESLACDSRLTDVQSIPVAAKEDRPPFIVHILPVRGLAHDVFDRGFALIVVTPVVPKDVPTAEVLQGLFDLTPGEARVAHAIGKGRAIETIATAAGVSRETVRTQLKMVFAKTGLNRQAELVALLSGIALSPG
jgi:DNA-binding CsgD family transcriptional regulator